MNFLKFFSNEDLKRIFWVTKREMAKRKIPFAGSELGRPDDDFVKEEDGADSGKDRD